MKWTRLTHFMLAALPILGFTGRSACAGGLVMFVAGSGNEFGTLDLSNPANINYRPIGTTSTEFFGMGFTSNGNLYGLGVGNFASDLFQIDPPTGIPRISVPWVFRQSAGRSAPMERRCTRSSSVHTDLCTH